MNEGYWINYLKDKVQSIDEHERWIRRWPNAKKIGVPQEVYDEIMDEFEPVNDRDEMLVYLMEKSPLMRVRGHGSLFSFEFNTRSVKKALDAVWEFCMDNAGPYTNLYIVNFATKETVDMLYKDFKELMEDGREDAVLRYAKKFKMRRGSKDIRSFFGRKVKIGKLESEKLVDFEKKYSEINSKQ